MKLVKTFQDKNRIYFLAELVKGKDLFDCLQVLNILDKVQGNFYFASILIIIDYLH